MTPTASRQARTYLTPFATSLGTSARSEEPNPVIPAPPDFAACVTRLKASSAGSASAGTSETTLRSRCSAHYDALKTTALDSLILDDWLIGGAAEEGVTVNQQQLDQRLQSLKRERRGNEALLERNLAAQGRTMADYVLETRVQMLAEGTRSQRGPTI